MVRRPVLRRPCYGLPSVLVTAAGGALVLVAFLLLDWFNGIAPAAAPSSDGIEPTAKLTLRAAYVASTQSRLGALVHAYVAWLGWALVFAAALAALAASLPGPRANGWRVAGLLAGLGGAVATYFACQFSFASDPDRRLHVDAHAGFGDTLLGAKLALVGFLVCAVGAALGPLGARAAEGDGPAQPALDAVSSGRRVGSTVAVVAAAALLVIAFDHSAWYETDRYDADPQITFGDFINLSGGRAISRVSLAFFPTLAWVLLMAAVLVVGFANLRTALTPVLRATGIVIGLGGVVLTYVALSRLFHVTYNPTATDSERDVFHGSSLGLWFAFAGYLLCAAAAAIAPPARARASDTIGA